MKIKLLVILVLVTLAILIGTSATLATNWVKYEFDDRLISWYYIDSDSVTKTNSGIIYWMKTVKTHFSGRNDWHEIVIELHEVKMLKSSRWDRTLEHYEYDDNDKLTNKYINYDSDFGEIRPGNASEDEAKAIDAALPYAKQRQVRTTFGTNWFYIISIFSEDRDKSGFYCIDYDSITLKGDLLTFRYKIQHPTVYSNYEGVLISRIYCKYSANIIDGIGATIESHIFDGLNKEHYTNTLTNEMSPYKGTAFEKLVQYALEYGKQR